ncbi:FAD-binding oxidoreductase [Micromonospora craterilacus]|uniref:FAD-binding oxidoreductase n=1 Tax=Micromonospora craterilacus TaxID=1655439 RepID=UPI001F2D1E6D|nr:FAD-binding oxidoreductase [Micromonospora craterilacus]
MTEPEVREAVGRWLSLVAADTELSPYLIGVDWDRLKAHLARSLTSGTGGEAEIPRLGWSEAQHRRAVDYLTGILETQATVSAASFWEAVEDRCAGLLPEREAPLLQAALHQLASRADDRPNRLALLAVLGRAYRRYGLHPAHAAVIGEALRASVPWRLVERAGGRMGDGPAWWPAEVVGHDRACDGVAILTVRPWRRLPYQSGQAVPVCTPRRPGLWRWLCPANAPRPDGTVELHVRAVPDGAVSTSLVHEVRPGELLHLGPPVDIGLSLVDGDLLLVAGGTGLAPLRALVEQVAADPDVRRVTPGRRGPLGGEPVRRGHPRQVAPRLADDRADVLTRCPGRAGGAGRRAHRRPQSPAPRPGRVRVRAARDAGRVAAAAARRWGARRADPPAGTDPVAMTVYRSRNALTGPLTPDQLAEVDLPWTRYGRRGYQTAEVDALLHRLVFELADRERRVAECRAENQRIKKALRTWQSDQANARADARAAADAMA